MPDVDRAQLTRVMEAAADAASAAIRPHFRAAPAVENKLAEGFDPVTEADRAAERAMRAVIADARPEDGILGEEYGATTGTSGLIWVLDPIDGTRAFVAGAPTWGVLIAASDASGPLIGLIDQPHTGERFVAGDRAVLRHGGQERPLRTRDVPLDQAVLMTTFPEVGTPEDAAAFRRVAADVRLTRYGLDCYAYGLVALGCVDLVIEAGLAPYDIQGPQAVIEAAGGVVTTWEGGPAHHGGRIVAAGSAALHAAALERLAG